MRKDFFHNTASNVTRFHMAYKWTREKLFFKPPIFDHLKLQGMSEIMFSHQKRVKKAFFSIQPPPGGLVLPNKSQLSNLQNGHTEMLFLIPHFDHLKTTGHVGNHVFSSEEG